VTTAAAEAKSSVQAGVVARVQYQESPRRFEYHLTTSGRALLPVLDGLLAWGKKYAVARDDPDRDRHRRLSRVETS